MSRLSLTWNRMFGKRSSKRKGNCRGRCGGACHRGRSLSMEPLEERTLLSVSPLSDETLLNTYTSGTQRLFDSGDAVAALPDGGYVTTWTSENQDGGGKGVYGQRFSASGAALGGEFRANTTTSNDQQRGSVAAAADGSFVIVWQSSGQDGDGKGVFGQRYAANGQALGGEFRVNVTTQGDQEYPAVACLSGGGFVVVWSGRGAGDNSGVFGRRYDADGSALGGEFLINTYTDNQQQLASVAALSGGGFIVAWQSHGGQDGDNTGIFAQRFNADGTKLGNEFRVNTTTNGHQQYSAIGVGPDGQFTIAWQSNQDVSGWGVFAQRYNADGTTAGGEFRANAYTADDQEYPSVAYNDKGGFVIAWSGKGTGDNNGVFIREYGPDGAALSSSESLVNQTTDNAQKWASVVAAGSGYVVAWSGKGAGDNEGVFARRLGSGPIAANIEGISVKEDSANVTVDISASLADAENSAASLSYQLLGNTNPELFSAVSVGGGQLSFSCAADRSGIAELTIRATDPGGLYAETSLVVHVEALNDAPVALPISPIQVFEDASPLTIDLGGVFNDVDGRLPPICEIMSIDNPALLAAAWIDRTNNSLVLEFASEASGAAEIVLRATDEEGLWVEATVPVVVLPVNDAPLAAAPSTVLARLGAAGTALDLSTLFSDIDDPQESLRYQIIANDNPALVAAHLQGRRLVLFYQPGQTGTAAIVVRAADPSGLYDENSYHTINVTVSATNLAPRITGLLDAPDPAIEGATLHLAATGVIDDTTVASVSFWRDADHNNVFDPQVDQLLDVDTNGADGWAVSVSSAGFGAGPQRYFAQATDADALAGEVATAIGMVGAAAVLDNEGAGYEEIGQGWTDNAGGGYLGTARRHEAGTGENTAVWTFDGLMPQPHEVYVTWTAAVRLASNAQFAVYDGQILLGTFSVDQRVAPEDEFDQGIGWHKLGEFTVAGGQLRIVLSDAADGAVVADAVRVVDPPPTIGSLSVTSTVTRPADVTLTANNVADSDGTVVEVRFYRDTNGNATLDVASDELLGTDTNGGDGWSITADTLTFTTGTQTYFARAKDNAGLYSTAVWAQGVVEGPAVYGPTSVYEGNTYTLLLDPLGYDIDEWTIDWGDGSQDDVVAGTTRSLTHVYADGVNNWTIAVTGTDGVDTYYANTIAVTVLNVVPYLSISGSSSVNEGAQYILSLSVDDPGDDTISSWTINWGDGNIQQVSGNPSSVVHYYADGPGTYTITATATDEDGTYATGGVAGALDLTFGTAGRASTSVATGVGIEYGRAMTVDANGRIIVAGYSDSYDMHLARYNADGSLDSSFGVGGRVISDFGGMDIAMAVAVQSDGKILVAGYQHNSTRDFILARYHVDGSLDLSFGDGGRVTTDFASSTDYGLSIAVQTDDKILVGGYAYSGGSYNFALARYTADGRLDPGFGTGGKVTTDFAGSTDYGRAMALQSDGKIVVAGQAYVSGSYDFAVARYNTNGTLDTTFDGDGKATTSFGSGTDEAYAVAVQGDKIVVAGRSYNGSNYDFAVARYNISNGSLDTTFDGDGKKTIAIGSADDSAYAVAVQSSGAILVAGDAYNGSNYDFAVIRCNADGTLDTGFDGDGKLTIAFGSGNDTAYTMVLRQADNKILVAGSAYTGYSYDFAVARLNLGNGGLDTGFDGDGKLTTDFPGQDVLLATAVQTDQKIVAVGYSCMGSTYDFTVARYNADGTLDANFGNGGTQTTGFPSATTDQAYAVVLQADQKIVVAGYSNSDFAVARYTTAGVLDTTFSGDGLVTTALGYTEYARSVAIQSDSKIVTAGFINNNGNYDFALVRYESNGNLDTSFDGDSGNGNGMVITPLGSGHDYAYAMALQTISGQEKILVAGYTYNGSNYDFALVRYNADGTLDAGFDGDGKITLDFAGGDDYAYAMTLQADGKILVAGYAKVGSYYDFALVRFNPDGTRDSTFGWDGKVLTSFATYYDDYARAIQVQADGKILVAGYTYINTTIDLALARYNSDGTLDAGFDGDGKLTTDFGKSTEYGYSMSLQADGRIVVAGMGQLDFTLARYLPGNMSLSLAVNNVAPTLSVVGNQTATEAQTISITDIGTFTDPGFGTSETFTYTIDWGDDTSPDSGAATIDTAGSAGTPTAGSFNGSHVYVDDGVYTVTVTITDDDGGSDTETFQVTVSNVAVIADAGGPYYVAEGGSVGLDASNTYDPGGGPITYEWDLDGDGIFGETGTAAARGNETGVSPTFQAIGVDGPGSIAVVLRATGYGGVVDMDRVWVNVYNTAPTIQISGNATVAEGAAYVLSLSASDPGLDTISGWEIYWGDGTVESISGNPSTVTHYFPDGPASHAIWAKATDEDGYYYSNYFYVSVTNVAPTLSVVGNQTVNEGQLLKLTNIGVLTDPGRDNTAGYPATYETFHYTIDWGDLTTPDEGTATIDFPGTPGHPTWGSFDGSHVYADDGVYTVTVTLADDDGGQATQRQFQVTVVNVAPYLTISGGGLVNEGSPYTLHLSASDPGDDTISGWEIDWGDGYIQQVSGNPPSVVHSYTAGPGTFTITALATDEDGTYTTGGAVGGTLDPTFGRGGTVRMDLSGDEYGSASAMAVQPDGKILVAGEASDGDFHLARFLSGGGLDASFGTGGRATADLGGWDYATAVAVQADGRIVVAGYRDGDFCVVRFLADGQLDATFGAGGYAIADFGNSDEVRAVAIQADSKIVVAGYAYVSGGYDFALARFTADGQLDESFSGDGKLTTAFGTNSDQAYAVAIQADGKIVAAGYAYVGGNYDFALARYTSAGELDTTFDGDGKVTTPFGTSSDYAYALAIQADGKIVAAGYAYNGSNYDFAVSRYTSTGALDSTFNLDGKVTIAFGTSSDYAYGVAVQPDGKIVVAGYAYMNGTGGDFALARFTAAGDLDTSFSGDGRLTTDFNAGYDYACGVALLPDGKILAGGYGDGKIALARYTAAGDLDWSFDGDGKATAGFGGGYDYVQAAAVQADGKLLVAGTTEDGDFRLIRYKVDGSLDASFGTGGAAVADFGANWAEARAVTIQADGKIIVAGYAYNGSNADFALVRFTAAGALDTSFGTWGKVIVDFNNTDDYAFGMAIDSLGRIVLAGYSYGGGNGADFALARFSASGVLDTSFGTGGKTTTDFAGRDDYANGVAIDSQDRIVLAGFRYDVNWSGAFALARYTSDGELDEDFGADGLVAADFGGYWAEARAVAVQPDGKIVAAGVWDDGYGSCFAVARFDDEGALDAGFGTGGLAAAAFDGYGAYAYAVAIQSDGKIVAGGSSYNDTDWTCDFALARFTADGSLDSDFGAGGMMTTALGGVNYAEEAYALALHADGRITAVGATSLYYVGMYPTDIALARYLPGEIGQPVTVLKTYRWVGGGSDEKWSTKENWAGNEVPESGCGLVFAGEGMQTENDLEGLEIKILEFASGGFTLTGNKSIAITDSILVSTGATNTVIGLNVVFAGPIAVDTAAGVKLTISGNLTGSGSLVKTGPGTLKLSGQIGENVHLAVTQGELLVGDEESVFVDTGNVVFGDDRPGAIRVLKADHISGYVTCNTTDLDSGYIYFDYEDQVSLHWFPGSREVNTDTCTVTIKFDYSSGYQIKILPITIGEDLPPAFRYREEFDSLITGDYIYQYSKYFIATDDEDAVLAYELVPGLTGLPPGATIDSTGHFTCQFGDWAGSARYDFWVKATDSSGNFDLCHMALDTTPWLSDFPMTTHIGTGIWVAENSQDNNIWHDFMGCTVAANIIMDYYPSHGTLEPVITYYQNGGYEWCDVTFYYTPEPNYQGVDVFSYHWDWCTYNSHYQENIHGESRSYRVEIPVGKTIDLTVESPYATDTGDIDQALLVVGEEWGLTLSLDNPQGDGCPTAGYWYLCYPENIIIKDKDGKELIPYATTLELNTVPYDKEISLTVTATSSGWGSADITAYWVPWESFYSFPYFRSVSIPYKTIHFTIVGNLSWPLPDPVSPPVCYASDSMTSATTFKINVITATGGTGNGGLTYNSRYDSTLNFGYGPGWSDADELPRLFITSAWGNDAVGVVATFGPERDVYFNKLNNSYYARYGAKMTLTQGNGIFTLQTADGTLYEFYDFTQTDHPRGTFKRSVSPDGDEVWVAAWTESGVDGKIAEVRYKTSASADAYQSRLFSYVESGANAGNIASVTLRQRNGENWDNVRRLSYEYYDGVESYGLLGDLKFIITQQWDGQQWADVGTDYFRYYTETGKEHLLKRAILPNAFAKLYADTSGCPESATETPQQGQVYVGNYTCFYYEYTADRRMSKKVVFGESNESNVEIIENPNNINAINLWSRKTVEHRLDGSVYTVYVNYLSQTLLTDLEDAAHNHIYTYNMYDSQGRLRLAAEPSAIAGYAVDAAGNWDQKADVPVEFTADGLVHETTYYAVTTPGIDEDTDGGVAGYVRSQLLRHGFHDPNPVLLSTYTYFAHTANGQTIYPVASYTTYADEAGQVAVTTAYAYAWYSASLQYQEIVTTLLAVSTEQNGSGLSATTRQWYDADGNLAWSVNELGRVTYYHYDPLTGRMDWMIEDVDSDLSAALNPPSGYEGNADGLHLRTDYRYDALGRATQTLGPAHTADVNGTPTLVRSASWTAYLDAAHETRSAQGYAEYNETTEQWDLFTIVGPISIVKTDLDSRTTEQIQADSSGLTPANLATAAIYQSSYTSWTTYQYQKTRLVSTRSYHTIPAPESGAGTLGTNYYQTNYGYENYGAGKMGRQNRVVSPDGTITRYVYDARGNVVQTWIGTDDSGATDLDPTGNHAQGNNMLLVSAAIFDNDGRLAESRAYFDAGANDYYTTHYTYDWRGRMTAVTQNYIDGVFDPDHPDQDVTAEYQYDNLGRMIVQTDPLGNETAYLYDVLGRQYRVTQPDPDGPSNPLESPVTNYYYDAAGNLVAVVDALGIETRYEYDGLGRQIKVIQNYVDGEYNSAYADEDVITAYAYDAAGQLTSATDPLGNVTTYVYDALGRQIKIIQPDPDGAGPLASPETEYVYDAAGRLVAVTNPLGKVTSYEYDALGRTLKVIQPDPDDDPINTPDDAPWTVYVYDAAGRVLSATDRLGHSTSYQYDALGRLTLTTNANSEETAYTYDLLGRRLTLTDPAGNTTAWVYDGLDRVVQEVSPLPLGEGQGEGFATRYFAYNSAGLLIEKTDRNGRVTQYEYDNLYRLMEENWLDESEQVVYTIAYSYDALGRVLSASSPLPPGEGQGEGAAVYEYQYDALGRVIVETQTFSGLTPVIVFAYQYNAAGQRTQSASTIGGAADAVTDYFYDSLGRLSRLEQHGASGGNAVAEKRVDFIYDAASKYATVTRYADLAGTDIVAVGTYGYDALGRLTSLVYTQPNSTGLPFYGWRYDAAGNMTWMESLDGEVDYSQDDTGQLTGADYNYQTDETYTYDDNGNRTNAGYVTGVNNQLLADGMYRYQYDAEGNRVLKYIDVDEDEVFDSGDTDATVYTWDHRNRLTAVSHFDTYALYNSDTSDQIVSYSYDYQNRLIRRTLDPDGSAASAEPIEQTVFIHEGNQIALQFEGIGGGDLGAGDLAHRYLWNPQAVDQLFADEQIHWDSQEEEFITDELLWALTDHINSVRDLAVYDANNDITTIANHRVLNAFGKVTSETNSLIVGIFGFTGRFFDPATGQQWNLNRWYDCLVGRWDSEDPSGYGGGDVSLFRYCGNNPILRVDPSGQCSMDDLLATICKCEDAKAELSTMSKLKITSCTRIHHKKIIKYDNGKTEVVDEPASGLAFYGEPREIWLEEGKSCDELAATLVHESHHTQQPASMNSDEAEIDAFTHETTIALGCGWKTWTTKRYVKNGKVDIAAIRTVILAPGGFYNEYHTGRGPGYTVTYGPWVCDNRKEVKLPSTCPSEDEDTSDNYDDTENCKKQNKNRGLQWNPWRHAWEGPNGTLCEG